MDFVEGQIYPAHRRQIPVHTGGNPRDRESDRNHRRDGRPGHSRFPKLDVAGSTQVSRSTINKFRLPDPEGICLALSDRVIGVRH